MPAEPGSAFLLKLASKSDETTYETIAGMTATQVTIKGNQVECTNSDSGGWLTLLSGAGTRSLALSATGIFMGSHAEQEARDLALSGRLASFQLCFASARNLEAKFLITALEYSGDVDGERRYGLKLQSSGPVTDAQ